MLVLFIALGMIPFALGHLMNWFMMNHINAYPPFVLFAVITLLIWAAIAYSAKAYIQNTKKVVIGLNLIAFLVLILVGIQELHLHAYWQNPIGFWTQLYYLPLMNISFQLTSWSHSVFSAYCAAFLLMILAALMGCKLRKS